MVTLRRTVSTSSRAMARSVVVAQHLDGAVVRLQRVVEGELVVGQAQRPRPRALASRISLASSISSSMTCAVSIARFW